MRNAATRLVSSLKVIFHNQDLIFFDDGDFYNRNSKLASYMNMNIFIGEDGMTNDISGTDGIGEKEIYNSCSSKFPSAEASTDIVPLRMYDTN